MVKLEHDAARGQGTWGPPADPSSDDPSAVELESCTATWHFEPERMRFRRTLKGDGVSGVSTGWRPYYGLRFRDAGESFSVLLNPEGTRMVTAQCHRRGSDMCGGCARRPGG